MGYRSLRRRVNKLSRNREFVNIKDAETVGILFQPVDDKSFETVKLFLKSLTEEGKQIFAIGYVDSPKIPDFYLLRKGINFFCKHDLSLFFRPEPVFVDDFIEREFDLLINLSVDNLYPLEYIYALSKAKFKAAKSLNGSDHSDLTIDIKTNRDVEFLIQQITHYLSLINKKE